MVVYLSIGLSICPIYASFFLSSHLPMYPSIQLSIHPSHPLARTVVAPFLDPGCRELGGAQWLIDWQVLKGPQQLPILRPHITIPNVATVSCISKPILLLFRSLHFFVPSSRVPKQSFPWEARKARAVSSEAEA